MHTSWPSWLELLSTEKHIMDSQTNCSICETSFSNQSNVPPRRIQSISYLITQQFQKHIWYFSWQENTKSSMTTMSKEEAYHQQPRYQIRDETIEKDLMLLITKRCIRNITKKVWHTKLMLNQKCIHNCFANYSGMCLHKSLDYCGQKSKLQLVMFSQNS
jgi:hypothetical protein